MATVKTDERNYMNIANAIRAKTGSTDTFTPGEMDAAILSIPAGSGGSGLTEEVKQALLDCFENVAWINDQGQTYYDALEAALYPPANLVSISAVFTQGQAIIYNTDSLDTLKQYLVVTAHYDDSSTQTINNYVLSGTLNVGTSIITVSYGGKTKTFSVVVTNRVRLPSEYQEVEYIENPSSSGNGAYFDTNVNFPLNFSAKIKCYKSAAATGNARVVFGWSETKYFGMCFYSMTNTRIGSFMLDSNLTMDISGLYDYPLEYNMIVNGTGLHISAIAKNNVAQQTNEIDFVDASYAEKQIRVFYYGSTLNQFNGRIYSLEVTNTDTNTKILELIPCYRKSDSVAGMYDLVNNVFYNSKTSVAFLKGSDVA